jgi:hypothetical protein
VVLGQVFSEYFGFPCQFSFHRLLHTHHLSSEASTIVVSDVPSGLSLTPPQENKKKAMGGQNLFRKRNHRIYPSLNRDTERGEGRQRIVKARENARKQGLFSYALSLGGLPLSPHTRVGATSRLYLSLSTKIQNILLQL